MLKAVFKHRDWKTRKPDGDDRNHFRYDHSDPIHLVICPEPACLDEWEETTRSAG